jgi:AcrR family transcriptional regulator
VPRAVREQQLIDVANELFAARGYYDTTIEGIVRAAGVSRPVFYDHFRTKEEIYLACVRAARTELDAALDAAVRPGDPPGDQLWQGISTYFAFVERCGDQWDVLFGDGAAVSGEVGEQARDMRFETVERIAALLGRAAPSVEPLTIEAFAHAVSGSAEQMTKWWRRIPGLERDQVASSLMAFAWYGLERLMREATAG